MKNAFKTYNGIEYGINEEKEVFFIDSRDSEMIEIPLNKIKKIQQFVSWIDRGINIYLGSNYIHTIIAIDTEDGIGIEIENATKDLDRFLDMYGNDNRLPWGEDCVIL